MVQKRKRKFDFASEEKKAAYLKQIIAFFLDERGEEIGFVAAEQVLDFFLQTIGDEIYKKGIKDTKKIITEAMENADIELNLLAEK